MSEVPPEAVWQEADDWVCDPQFVAPRLGLSQEAFRAGLREGFVSGTVEHGQGADAGRTRLTWRYRDRAWSVCVEPDGRIVEVAPPLTEAAALRWLFARR